MDVRVLVVTEYYPRAGDPSLGVWVHRQTVAARDAGADVRVLVLHRPIPPLRTLREPDLSGALAPLKQPRHETADGLAVDYVRYLSPPRPWSYATWGAWAAPALGRALHRVRPEFTFDLVHAHYAVPAGDAVRRAAGSVPLVVSVHGHDVHGRGAGAPAVRAALSHARLVLANSAGTATRCSLYGAHRTKVVHLGADVPAEPSTAPPSPTLVTVAHLAARKRHEDVIVALSELRDRRPGLRYVIVGDGPERERLEALARSLDLAERVEFRGAATPEQAVAAARDASLFVMPSVDEAFGVAYIEAMAAGVPAVGCAGEDGPEEIAAAGQGLELVPPRDPSALALRIDQLLGDPERLTELARHARATVEREFTWTHCGTSTVEAYDEALAK
jgi:glycosyltransferase involved in cell wall biosynthesis